MARAGRALIGKTHRLAGLDALRGAAATAVMIYHYTTWNSTEGPGHTPPGPSVVFPYGNLGVELFFIISGFVIFMTLERTQTLRAFAVSRIARLYPAFLASMAATLAVTVLLGSEPLHWDRILASLTMAPHLFGVHAVDDVYWSLLYEVDFYILAAICVLVMGWRDPDLPCAIWLILSLALRLSGIGQPGTIIEALTSCSFAHLFVIGIMLYRLHSGHTGWRTLALLAVAVEVSLLGPAWSLNGLSGLPYMLVTAGFTALVWFGATQAGRVLARGPMRLLGWASYPLYLVHRAAGYLVLEHLEAAGVSPDAAILVTFGLAIGTACAISATVEYRGQRWIKVRLGTAGRYPQAD